MQVHVLFFGILKDLAGLGDERLDLPEHAVLGDVLAHYATRIPKLREFSASLAMSINQEYAGPNSKLHAGDEVALLPPVSGGVGDGAVDSLIARTNCVKIVREKIDTAGLLETIHSP
jgi:molybdopterin converting factor subunit 1